MRFTEQHQIERPSDADWFDLNVEMDSPLYVDPFLLFDDPDSRWAAAHDEIIDFFDATIALLKKAASATSITTSMRSGLPSSAMHARRSQARAQARSCRSSWMLARRNRHLRHETVSV